MIPSTKEHNAPEEREKKMSEENKTENTVTNTSEMANKLKAAGKKAEDQKAQRRERTVKGSHLLPALTKKAQDAGYNIQEMSGFWKVTGSTKGRRVLIAKKGGRVDLSGFSIDAQAVSHLTEEEARQKHLGKVRAQLDFSQPDDAVLAAYDSALAQLVGE